MTFQKVRDAWIEIWDSEDTCHTFNLDDLALIKRIEAGGVFRMELLVKGWSLYLLYGLAEKGEMRRETDYHDLLEAKIKHDSQKHAIAMKMTLPT